MSSTAPKWLRPGTTIIEASGGNAAFPRSNRSPTIPTAMTQIRKPIARDRDLIQRLGGGRCPRHGHFNSAAVSSAATVESKLELRADVTRGDWPAELILIDFVAAYWLVLRVLQHESATMRLHRRKKPPAAKAVERARHLMVRQLANLRNQNRPIGE